MKRRRQKPKRSIKAHELFDRVYSWAKKKYELVVFLGSLVGLLTFTSGRPYLSSFFILVVCLSLAFLIWRTRGSWWLKRQPAAAIGAMALVILTASVYVGHNLYPRYLLWRGYYVRVAEAGELLILLTDFKKMGNEEFNVIGRIQQVLKNELDQAKVSKTRIELIPVQISTTEEARALGERHGAVFVIWGYYDSAAIHSTFTITAQNITAANQSPFSKSSLESSQVRAEPLEFNLYVDKKLPKQMLYFATVTLGLSYYQKKDYASALPMLNAALGDVEGKPEGLTVVYYYRARTLEAQGKLREALDDYSRAIDTDRQNKFALNDRGLLYFQEGYSDPGKFDLAFADFEAAIAIDANFAPPYNNRGNVHQMRKEYDLALADYTRALALNPQIARTYNNIAALYDTSKKNDPDKMLENLNKAIELAPSDGEIFANRCYAYLVKKELDLALEDCNQALELKASSANTYYYRGIIYRQKGLKPEAIADFEHYLELPNISQRTQVEQWLNELKSQ